MTSAQTSKVIIHSIQVIHHIPLSFRRNLRRYLVPVQVHTILFPLLLAQLHTLRHAPLLDPLAQVQAFQREVDEIVKLVAETTRRSESLDANDEDIGRLVNVELFRSGLMLFADGAVPQIILSESLFLAKLVQTFLERDGFSGCTTQTFFLDKRVDNSSRLTENRLVDIVVVVLARPLAKDRIARSDDELRLRGARDW